MESGYFDIITAAMEGVSHGINSAVFLFSAVMWRNFVTVCFHFFGPKPRQIVQKGFLYNSLSFFLPWTSRCVCIYYKTVVTHHQHIYLLRFIREWHRYMFRPLSGHLRAIQIRKITSTIASSFLYGWTDSQTFGCYWVTMEPRMRLESEIKRKQRPS